MNLVFSGWYKYFVSQKFNGIKGTRCNFFDVISYVNIDTELGNILGWDQIDLLEFVMKPAAVNV